jgi:hypothetical protein
MLLFENYIQGDKAKFIDKLQSVSSNLGIDPNWLMAVMWKESTLNPAAVNPKSGASGLIQFMPATATGLGTTTENIRKMDSVAQLDLVKRFYAPYRYALNDYPSLYLATFFPVALGKSDTWVLKSDTISASRVALQNPIIDLNGDQQITVEEFKEYCYKNLSADVINVLKKKI